MDFRDTPEEAAFRSALAIVAGGEPPRGVAGAEPVEEPAERRGLQGVEQEAPRGWICGSDVASGVRGSGGTVHAPGGVPRRDGSGGGPRAHRRHRVGHGRADDHLPRY